MFTYLVGGISNSQDPPEVPAREDVVFEGHERGLQAVGVNVAKRRSFSYLVGEMFLCEGAFVVFCEFRYGVAVCFGGLCEEEPVEAVFGGGEGHVAAVLEEGVDLEGGCGEP